MAQTETTSHQPTPGWGTVTSHVRLAPAAPADPAVAADRLAIAECIHRYGWGYDERSRELLADCFTADGIWEGSLMGADQVGPYEGRDAVVTFLTDFWAVQTDQRRHIFTNVVVTEVTGSAAVAHAYLLLTASTGGTMTPVTNGPYRFEMRNDGGVWRMARLVAGFDAPF
jgi:SnoaL-like domain